MVVLQGITGMSKDVLNLVLCHELGHFDGGLPKKFRGYSQMLSWSSAEGQADYFSTSVCFREVIESEAPGPTNSAPSYEAELSPSQICKTDKVCSRMLVAGFQVNEDLR